MSSCASYELITKACESHNFVIEVNVRKSNHMLGHNVVGYGNAILIYTSVQWSSYLYLCLVLYPSCQC